MDNMAFKTIPLETALEYHAFAAERGRKAGAFNERQRILELLKKKGMYDAIFAIKKEENNRASHT
jgi:hypothetical protein